MSRPCFALSVMLCCLGGPLLIIGKTQAQDTVVSPSHRPGECIVCPLAHGPLEACGGYSDYDYNNYWYDDYAPPASEDTTPAAPDLEVAQSLGDGATEEEPWESDYDDYYADYVYGDVATSADAEDLTLESTPAPAALIEPAAESAPSPDVPPSDESFGLDDEYGWYADDTDASEDYFDSYDNYEPIEPTETEAVSPEEATRAEAEFDYEAYEEEWFSYGAETNVEAQEVNPEVDEAYEALSESVSEAFSDEIIEAQPADELWGDEEAWYCEEYGYHCMLDEASLAVDPTEQLETGYDEAYDEAMDLEPAEPAAEIVPADPIAESLEANDYESFYDAYDDLYNFEPMPAESSEAAETLESVTSEPALEQQAADAEPAWLAEFVERVQTALNEQDLDRDAYTTNYADECAREWDCEAEPCEVADAEPAWLAKFVERVQTALNAPEPDCDSHTANYEDERAWEWDREAGAFEAAESFAPETSEAAAGPAVEEQAEQATDTEPTWLTELVDRMLAPMRTDAEAIALNAPLRERESRDAIEMDECAQEWEGESYYWARSQPEEPSVVLSAADTLDGVAAVLQNAADFLRGVASGSLAETAQVSRGESPR